MTTQVFRKYRKTSLTFARPLSAEDYAAFGGIIQTPEGPSTFEVGDYLAQDAKGTYPIPRSQIEQNYQCDSEPSKNGWASYQPLNIRDACQMSEPFTVDTLTGKAGDYLVRSGDAWWPVDREIFESSYELIEE